MLGTQFPGDGAQVRALADLFENALIPRLGELIETLSRVHDDLVEYWTGQPAVAAQKALDNGRTKIRMLVEVMGTCIDQLRLVADHLDGAQEAVVEVESMALEAELPWYEEEMIRRPLPSDYGIQPGADRTDIEVQDAEKEYNEALGVYQAAEGILAEAISPILDDLPKMDEEIKLLSTGLLSHMDFVNFTPNYSGQCTARTSRVRRLKKGSRVK